MNRCKKCGVGIYSNTLFSHKKGNAFMTVWMDLEEIRQRKANTICSKLFCEIQKAELIEMRVESCLPGAWAL